MKRLILLAVLLFFEISLFAQNDSIWQKKPKVNVESFVDLYYIFDSNKPTAEKRQPFLYNHTRHDEVYVNLLYVQLDLTHEKYRANFGLHYGTYVVDNYAEEIPFFQVIREANAGLSLNKKNSLWVDAGIFSSIYGFENSASAKNMTLTRSLSAESAPYFSSGIRLTYSPSNDWKFVGEVSNGWQRIQRVDGSSMISLGSQLTYTPTDHVTLSWSSFYGTVDPDSTRRIRFFNSFYTQLQFGKVVGIIAGWDFGRQQQYKDSESYNLWMVPTFIAQFTLNKYVKMAFRLEYYQDPNGVIIPTSTPNGFQTTGFSWNIDVNPIPELFIRSQIGRYGSQDAVFATENGWSKTDIYFGISAALLVSSKAMKRN